MISYILLEKNNFDVYLDSFREMKVSFSESETKFIENLIVSNQSSIPNFEADKTLVKNKGFFSLNKKDGYCFLNLKNDSNIGDISIRKIKDINLFNDGFYLLECNWHIYAVSAELEHIVEFIKFCREFYK